MNKKQRLFFDTTNSISVAAKALEVGHVVAFPTETVYGLGADAMNEIAIKRIYEIKGRPKGHPLIIHISSIDQLNKWAREIPNFAIALANEFWPGPMTLILRRSRLVGDFITGSQDTVGLRVPSDPIALGLILEFEKISNSAIAAPSANRFGQVSPTSVEDVIEELGSNFGAGDMILKGGVSTIGIESTIVDCTNKAPVILRAGKVTRAEIESLLGHTLKTQISSPVKFSGEFEKHYAPKSQVILDVEPVSGDCFMAPTHVPTPVGVHRICSPESVEDFAKHLYSSLRESDRLGFKRIVIIQPSGEGLALAIRERLLKASKGR
jgi:L-threonylcarbamoyladenylate synthase